MIIFLIVLSWLLVGLLFNYILTKQDANDTNREQELELIFCFCGPFLIIPLVFLNLYRILNTKGIKIKPSKKYERQGK